MEYSNEELIDLRAKLLNKVLTLSAQICSHFENHKTDEALFECDNRERLMNLIGEISTTLNKESNMVLLPINVNRIKKIHNYDLKTLKYIEDNKKQIVQEISLIKKSKRVVQKYNQNNVK